MLLAIVKDCHYPIRGDTGYFPLRHVMNPSMGTRGLLPAGHGPSGKYPISPLGCGDSETPG